MEINKDEKCIKCSKLNEENNYCCIWNGFIDHPESTNGCADFSSIDALPSAMKIVEAVRSRFSKY